MYSLPTWITPGQYDALERLVSVLHSLRVPYTITGGLAGNLHGSAWPLQDIDLDVPGAALPVLARTFGEATRYGPETYRDEEFEIELLTLDLDGVTIDLAAAESIVLMTPDGRRHHWPTDLTDVVERRLGALILRVQPRQRLIGYKRLLGRTADLADLETLPLDES